jgi:formylglycine-generating enzyme required for sulfatase activity
MSKRPAIPAEIARRILIESGHRCAVCGASCPLERAHIIPWHKSKEHKAEDLICLCANCHQRADHEKWGVKTFREYKRNPWILRQYEKAEIMPQPATQTAHFPGLTLEQVRAEIERVLREKAPQVDRALTSASELSIGGDATGSVVLSAGGNVFYLNLAERHALHQAVSHVADDDLRNRLALLWLAVSQDLAPGPDPAALLQAHLEELAGRLERERPWARGLQGYVPLATHLNQCFSLRTLPRGGPGLGRHFEERARFDDLAQAVEQAADEDGQPLLRFALLGEPGAGKSTALRKLALQAVRTRLADPDAPFPLFVRLSDHRTGSPAEFLADEWRRTYGDEFWKQVLEPDPDRPRVWLFADGLNEMSPDGYHDRVAAWRKFLRDELPRGNRALVACRVADYGDALGLPRLEIQPLDPERIQTFLRNYLPDRADDLWGDLLADRQRHGDEHSLYGLAANPFWLTMIVAVYRALLSLPEGHADLIEHFVEEWLKYEAERPGGRALSPEEVEAFKRAVARLAYPLLERGQNVPQPRGEVLAWLPEQVDVEGKPMITPPDDTLRLAESVNLVMVEGEPGARTVRFYHQLLLEHFAGREMSRRFRAGEDQSVRWRIPWESWQFVDSEWDPLPPPPTTGWEEATALAAACLAYPDPRQAEALARAVLAHHPPLAARCLLEAGLVPPEGVKAVTDRLLAIIGGQTPPGLQPDQALCLRRACGLALGRLGDPRILAGENRPPDGVRFIQPQWSQAIPAGPFLMGSDRDEEGAYDEEYSAATGFQRHRVNIPYEYRIGLYPVTNAEYRCFIDDGGYEKEGYWPTEAARRWLRGQADLGPTLRWWRWLAERVRRDPDLPERYLREKRIRPQEAETWKWAAAADDEELVAAVRQAVGLAQAPRAPRFWDDRAYNNPSQPVVGVCWYEAMAYCAWLTEQMSKTDELTKMAGDPRLEIGDWRLEVRLPTEAEWEKAARWDGKRARRYPWGDRWDPFQCNSLEGRVLTPTPVGIYPGGASPCGALDMAGNVWEWTRSLWGPEFERPAFGYPYNAEDGREDEESSDLRVLRGGSFDLDRDVIRCAVRLRGGPDLRDSDLGFRVVVVSPGSPISGL